MSVELDGTQRRMLAEMFALLGDPSRLGIVLSCRHQRRSVSDIAEASGLSMSLVSHHLRLLRTAELLKVEREGRYAFYSIADAHVEHMLDDMVDHVLHANGASRALSTQPGGT
ncbi:MAG: metalloregulator ArsR/SmtB family transcription factor [Candidatus Thiosymbion ectosymbiont of Robbea hypermnestra]|nr:metalloregulator ArsR/SmtB family transcription factor [Candidatus Thiosymbion ectosymbiont of Robbea hypermnestra]